MHKVHRGPSPDREDRVCVIAEAGSCHDGEYERAAALVDVAHLAGADAVKFQFWSDADRLADRRRVEPVYRAIYHRYAMPASWLAPLAALSDRAGLEFLCTVYLSEDIAVVAPYVQRFKVASFEMADDAFLLAHAPFGKPLLVSTGMSEEAEIARLYDRRFDALAGITILHFVSAYPCPPEAANLRAIRRLRQVWGAAVGYSDHTALPITGALAVAAGASILEVHLRLTETDPVNPDYVTALDPLGLVAYVNHVRRAEVMLGSGEKRPQYAEAAMLRYRVGPKENGGTDD